jgi:hypothetical protein
VLWNAEGEAEVNGFSVEPFCLLWSESDEVTTAIDLQCVCTCDEGGRRSSPRVDWLVVPFCALPLTNSSQVLSVNFASLSGLKSGRFAQLFLLQPDDQFGGVALLVGPTEARSFAGTAVIPATGGYRSGMGFLNVVEVWRVLLVFFDVGFVPRASCGQELTTATVSSLSILGSPPVPDINFWLMDDQYHPSTQFYDAQKARLRRMEQTFLKEDSAVSSGNWPSTSNFILVRQDHNSPAMSQMRRSCLRRPSCWKCWK